MQGEISTKVYDEDTAALSTVYYANYLEYYERGRTEMFGSHGHTVQELILPVESAYRLNLKQAIYRGTELINKATVELVCVTAAGALQEFPEELRNV